MKQIANYFGDRPVIGMATSAGSSILSMVNNIVPWLEVLGIIVGTLIGLLTLWLTIIKIATERRTKKCRELEERLHQMEIEHQRKIDNNGN